MMRVMVMGGHKPGGMADTAVAGVEIAAAVDIAGYDAQRVRAETGIGSSKASAH